jgi:uncharacterized FlgJ-related protein
MFYHYNKSTLKLTKIPLKYLIAIALLILLISLGVGFILKKKETHTQVVKIHVENKPEFTEDSLINLLKSLNIKFPHIVLAQSKIETGHFKSKIFLENHNLFGMKHSRQRASTAKGTQYNHAYYDSWVLSVYDYALYSCRYLSGFKNETEYLEYLKNTYAEDPNYVNKIKSIVKKENLKTKF